MARDRIHFGETWRVLAYTLVLALAFVALGRSQLAAFNAPFAQHWLQRLGLLDGNSDAELARQAQQVGADSRDAMQRAPPGHRLATLRLGYELGYASERVGVFATAAPQVREQAWQLAAPYQANADELAALLGVAPAPALRTDNLREFNELGNRYEADENGLAARVQQRLSPWHRHAYLLGVHIGIESARIDATEGEHSLPPASMMRRHATLAGMAPELWQPLAAPPAADEAPAQRVQRYRAAVQALADALAQQDAATAARR
ncbi:MAG TPA: hypothetical protein PLO41_08895 [Rubrivivax sp.]|nr:hypothetical protein [Rubrivivax sp.]